MKKPIVFKHNGDGNWRSRMQDSKGHWRTFKFVTGQHEPGHGDEPPPTTPSGAFVTIPKTLREVPAEKPAQTQPEPETPQTEPAQTPQSEEPQKEETKETSGFPPLCADAVRTAPLPGTTETDQPGATTPEPQKNTIPAMEMLIDSMFQMGEALGGPKAPKGSAGDGFTLESLRSMMVKSGREAFPQAEIEAGPKTTFFGCMGMYLFICSQHEEFRTKSAPLMQRMKEKVGLFWHRMKSRRKAKKEQKATQPKPEEKKEDA